MTENTAERIPVLLVTANLGSIFEDPSRMLKLWIEEFLSKVNKLKDVKFIALHCQEVGGKNYEKSMKHVETFVKFLTSSTELEEFNKIRVFLDEDYSSVENFTALGSFYFIHKSINGMIWDFKQLQFIPVTNKNIYTGNIEAVPIKEKAKFPKNFFPECKWSRKGYMRTRWSISGTIFDLINIHLFHDASNLVAISSYPSIYSKNRRHAFEHTLNKIHNDNYDNVPHFVFGDFNFRTDTEAVTKKLTDGLTRARIQNNKNNDHTKLHFVNEENKLVLRIGKKEFSHTEHEKIFFDYDWLKRFDKESEAFETCLMEYPINFAPSYPFKEEITNANSYMPTRCPAWCDRVLFSHGAKQIIKESDGVEYGMLGLNTCMGDHKPVYLKIALITDAGIVRCNDCHIASSTACLPEVCCQYSPKLNIIHINVTDTSEITNNEETIKNDIDSKFLQTDMKLNHYSNDPYTPESSTSRSPFFDENEKTISDDDKDNSVLADELKNKLENMLILNNSDYDVGTESNDQLTMATLSDNSQVGKNEKSCFLSNTDSNTIRPPIQTLKRNKSSVISSIEYKRFQFMKFKRKSRNKKLSCTDALCVIA